MGATWWPDENTMMASKDELMGPEAQRSYYDAVRTGWPNDGKGVWVLKFNLQDYESSRRYHERPTLLLNPLSDMDERCEAIKQLGGEYFQCNSNDGGGVIVTRQTRI